MEESEREPEGWYHVRPGEAMLYISCGRVLGIEGVSVIGASCAGVVLASLLNYKLQLVSSEGPLPHTPFLVPTMTSITSQELAV